MINTPLPPPPQILSPTEATPARTGLGLLAGCGIALFSASCVLLMSTMFFFAFWNDGSNDMSFVVLWLLSSLLIGGLAAIVVGLILGGGIGWYVSRRR